MGFSLLLLKCCVLGRRILSELSLSRRGCWRSSVFSQKWDKAFYFNLKLLFNFSDAWVLPFSNWNLNFFVVTDIACGWGLVVRASDCQCTSCNGPGSDPSIRRHRVIWGAADEAVLNLVPPKKIFKEKILPCLEQRMRGVPRSTLSRRATPS
jgi:hypothetical protein